MVQSDKVQLLYVPIEADLAAIWHLGSSPIIAISDGMMIVMPRRPVEVDPLPVD